MVAAGEGIALPALMRLLDRRSFLPMHWEGHMGEIKFGKELLGGTTDVLEDGRLIGRMSKVQGQWGFYQGNPPGQLASPRYKADSPEELLALIRQGGTGRGGLLR